MRLSIRSRWPTVRESTILYTISKSCSLLSPIFPGDSLSATTSIPSLPVDADAGGELRRLPHHLAQAGVRMDVRPHLPGGGVEEPGEGGLRDQLSGLVAQDVDAQDVAGVGVGHELHEAVRLIVDERHSVAAEGEALRFHAPSALPRLLLREAHRRHVRAGVGHAGYAAVVQGLNILAGDRLGGEVALGGGDVGELEPADNVAHGEDAGLGRAVACVDLDATLFDLHVGVFEAH